MLGGWSACSAVAMPMSEIKRVRFPRPVVIAGQRSAWPKGNPGQGRRKGGHNLVTTLIKEALLIAAAESGQDGKGKGGLVGYLLWLSRSQPASFANLLGKVLPMQIASADDTPFDVDMTVEQVRERLAARGIAVEGIFDPPAEQLSLPHLPSRGGNGKLDS